MGDRWADGLIDEGQRTRRPGLRPWTIQVHYKATDHKDRQIRATTFYHCEAATHAEAIAETTLAFAGTEKTLGFIVPGHLMPGQKGGDGR